VGEDFEGAGEIEGVELGVEVDEDFEGCCDAMFESCGWIVDCGGRTALSRNNFLPLAITSQVSIQSLAAIPAGSIAVCGAESSNPPVCGSSKPQRISCWV
jgi:hypothetical protein